MKAELQVYNSLKQTSFGSEATAVHSLRLAEHQYKREAELDFVVVSRFGMYVLEVKGGGVRRDGEGTWHYTDRYGNARSSSEGPFDQARSGMYSLKTTLFDHFGDELRRKLVYGFGVITPDSRLPQETPEWDERQFADKADLSGTNHLQGFLGGLRQYYEERYEANGRGATKLSEREIEKIVDFLRPKFDRLPSLVHRINDIREVLHSLTEEQYKYLDVNEENERILCDGGAGTGKTFLAMEVARRESGRGHSALLTCRSSSLSRYLESRLMEEDVDILDTNKVSKLDDSTEYDTLIVDEGQDVLSSDHLVEIFSHLRGGIQNGRWRFFYDPNRQSGFYEDMNLEALEWLREPRPAILSLSTNCRNPEPIVRKTQLYTGADLGDPEAGGGPEVGMEFVKDDTDATGRLTIKLRKLFREGVSPESIAILSPLAFEESSASGLPEDLRSQLRPLDSATASEFPFEGVAFSSIRNFKGFESDAVIVTDLCPDLAAPSLKKVLYVALSRARAYLVLILPDSTKKAMEELARKHLPQLKNA